MLELNIRDVFSSSSLRGVLSLEDHVFQGCSFDNFVVPGALSRAVTISRVRFTNCVVSPGTCMIRAGCHLAEVTFEEFECGDALVISSEAKLKKVAVAGEKYPKMLWIRPQREPFSPDDVAVWADSEEWCLDISNFRGEVSMTGIWAKNIVVDPDRHVVMEASLAGSLDWKSLGVHPLSYWKLMAKKASVGGGLDGIFSLPPESGRNFERSMRELELLRSEGLLG